MSKKSPIAIITGAGKRIGNHLALSLGQSGWDIAAHYHHSSKEIDQLKHNIEQQGQQFCALQADLSDAQAVKTIIPNCLEQLGAPSLLINNASLFEEDEIGQLEASKFDAHIAINLRAPIFLAQDFASALQPAAGQEEAQNNNIINITDQRCYNPGTSFYSYTISKIALGAATETLAKALAPHIRVNNIAPGPVLQSVHQTTDQFEIESKSTLLGRTIALSEITNCVEYILNSKSLTGETLHLDGGQRFQ